MDVYSEEFSCLNDCGCSEEQKARYFAAEENRQARILLLERHRCALMNELHEVQRKVDCVDYLLRGLRQENRRNYR